MTLTDHDLSELLAALKAGEMTDTIRTSLEWVLQQLIEAEATAFNCHRVRRSRRRRPTPLRGTPSASPRTWASRAASDDQVLAPPRLAGRRRRAGVTAVASGRDW